MKKVVSMVLLAMVLNGCAMVREIGVYRDQKAAEEQEYKESFKNNQEGEVKR